MRITNGNVTIDALELGGLSARERSGLQRKADATNISIVQYLQGVLTDLIAQAGHELLDVQLDAERAICEAYVRADTSTQDSVKQLLGL